MEDKFQIVCRAREWPLDGDQLERLCKDINVAWEIGQGDAVAQALMALLEHEDLPTYYECHGCLLGTLVIEIAQRRGAAQRALAHAGRHLHTLEEALKTHGLQDARVKDLRKLYEEIDARLADGKVEKESDGPHDAGAGA